MPRTRYNLAELRTRLSERVGNQTTFWKRDEFRDALNEGIAFWQALSGEWTTRIGITAKSNSPNFYPVPKQIVSVTRVGLYDESETLNPLGGTIVPPNIPVFWGSPGAPDLYNTATGVSIPWSFIPTGGVPPYRIEWDWGDGETTVGGLHESHAFDESVEGIDVDVTATVTDAAGDTFTADFTVEVVDQVIQLFYGAVEIPEGDVITVSPVTVGSYVYTPWMQFRLGVELDGDVSTTGDYANRYPIKIDWDFKPSGLLEDGGGALVDQLEVADSAQVVQETYTLPGNFRLTHTVENAWHFNDGAVSPGFPFQDPDAVGGGEGPSEMYQDPDNMKFDVDSDGVGERGYVRLRMPLGWFQLNGSDILTNFTMRVTDGTGHVTERVQKIQVGTIPPIAITPVFQSGV
jgi:hypothetical protein